QARGSRRNNAYYRVDLGARRSRDSSSRHRRRDRGGSMPRHRITQADVAAMAGVSQATVSFVLNDSTPAGVRISEETRQRVLDAVRLTGHSANPVAQRLAGGHNQIL